MPLDPQTVDVPLTGGLNLNDAKNLPPGDFAALDNVDFDPIRLRHGHTEYEVSDATLDTLHSLPYTDWLYGQGPYVAGHPSEAIDAPEAGRVYGVASLGNELLAWDGWRLMTRDASPSARWARVGGSSSNAMFCHAEESTVGWVGTDAKHFDVAVGKHRTLYVWLEGTLPYMSILDNATGATVVARTDLSTSSTSVTQIKPVYLTQEDQDGGTFFVLCNDSTVNDAFYTLLPEFDYGNPTTGTLTSDLASSSTPIDVRSHNGRAYCIYVSNVPSLVVATVGQGNTTSTTTLDTDGTTPADAPSAIAVHPDGTIMATWYTTVPDIRAAFYSMDPLFAATRLYSSATMSTDTPQRLSCEFDYFSLANVYSGHVAWWVLLTNRTSFRGVDGQTGALGSTRNIGDSRLSHQLMRVGQATFITVGYERANTLQYQMVTLELRRSDSTVGYSVPVASVFRTTYYPDASDHQWTRQSARTDFTDEVNGATFAQAAELARLLPTSTGVQQVKQGGGIVHYDFLPSLRSAKVGESLWFAGGVVREYDGNTLHEAGFLTYPQVTSALVAGGSLPTSGAPQYRVYLCHENAKGELHRSAALTHIADTPAAGNLTVRLTLPMLPFCSIGTVYWEIYRLDDGASVFKRVGTTTPSSLATVRYTDTTYDDTGTTITSNAVDPAPAYSPNGLGILDRICPPNCTIIAEGKERVWFAGGGVPERSVAYSRLYDPGEAPAWNEALVVNVPGEGAVTGVGFLADWCVVFRQNGSYVFGGPGPDNLGISGDFDPPRLAVADSGCISPDSVLLLPFGLARQSQAGIRALTGDLNDMPIGQPVDEALDVTRPVYAAASSPLWQQARWTTDDGTYVLDYSGKPRWVRWTFDCNAMCTYNGRVAAATQDGNVLLECDEDNDTSKDGDRGYDLNVQTGWLKPGASGGLANLDWWYLLGDWYAGNADSGLHLRVDYDYKVQGPQVDERDWRPVEVVSSNQDVGEADLSGSTYGTGTPTWYSTYGNFDLRRRFKRRRASACRFTVRGFGGLKASVANVSVEHRMDTGVAGRGSRNLS